MILFPFYSILDEYPDDDDDDDDNDDDDADDDDADVAHLPPQIKILRREASVESE